MSELEIKIENPLILPLWAIGVSTVLHGLLAFSLPYWRLYADPVNLQKPVKVVQLTPDEAKRLPQEVSPKSSFNFSFTPGPANPNLLSSIPVEPAPSIANLIPPPPPSSMELPSQPRVPMTGNLPQIGERLPVRDPITSIPRTIVPPPSSFPSNDGKRSEEILNLLTKEPQVRAPRPEDFMPRDNTRLIPPLSQIPTPPPPQIPTPPSDPTTNNGSNQDNNRLIVRPKFSQDVFTADKIFEAHNKKNNPINSNPKPGNVSPEQQANIDVGNDYLSMFNKYKGVYPGLETTSPLRGATTYPQEACPNKLTGKGVIGVVVKPDGKIASEPEWIKKTDSPILDKSGLEQVKKLNFPPTEKPKFYQVVVDFPYDSQACSSNPPTPGTVSPQQQANIDAVTVYQSMFNKYKGVYPGLETTSPLRGATTYPQEACPNKLTGQGVIGVVVKPDGKIAAEPEWIAKTGSPILDKSGLEQVKKLDFPTTEKAKLYQVVIDFPYESKVCSQTTPPTGSPSPSGSPSSTSSPSL
ncbi:MAG: hypothetical protein RLZZ338_2217 [Cyanobacteriota bacterium]